MQQKAIERQSLIVSTVMNFIMGLAGLIVFYMTGLNALLLDAVFTVIAFFSTLVAVFISRHSHQSTKSFPNGLNFLEPLYAIFKSFAILILLLVTTVESTSVAVNYFLRGEGELIETGPVLPYSIILVTLCWGLSFYNTQMNKKINNMSTMIKAEAKGNFVDGLITAGIGISLLILNFIPINGPLGFLHYTADFFVTIVLVCISLKEPLGVLGTSFKELTMTTTQDEAIIEAVHRIVKYTVSEHREMTVMVFKQGMKITVRLYIDYQNLILIDHVTRRKDAIIAELEKEFERVELEIIL